MCVCSCVSIAGYLLYIPAGLKEALETLLFKTLPLNSRGYRGRTMPVYLCSSFEVHPVYQYESVCCLTINAPLSKDYARKISERCHIAVHTWKRKHAVENKQLKRRKAISGHIKRGRRPLQMQKRFNEWKEQAVLVLWRVIEILKSTGAGPALFTSAKLLTRDLGSSLALTVNKRIALDNRGLFSKPGLIRYLLYSSKLDASCNFFSSMLSLLTVDVETTEGRSSPEENFS